MLENKPDIRALILVGEDEALVRMMLVDVLDDAGFKVMEAAHADEALHILAAAPDVQVVVTDVEMPRGSINGFELARRVRDDRQDIGVVIASGRVAPAPEGLPEGTYFVEKPVRPEKLLDLIRALLREGRECHERALVRGTEAWAQAVLGYGRPTKSASFRVRHASSASHL
jgi:CheY-like chemotaxis protein